MRHHTSVALKKGAHVMTENFRLSNPCCSSKYFSTTSYHIFTTVRKVSCCVFYFYLYLPPMISPRLFFKLVCSSLPFWSTRSTNLVTFFRWKGSKCVLPVFFHFCLHITLSLYEFLKQPTEKSKDIKSYEPWSCICVLKRIYYS